MAFSGTRCWPSLLVCLVSLPLASTRPLFDRKQADNALMYLTQYGYLESNRRIEENELRDAIRRFTEDIGYSRTELSLRDTLSLMKRSRCSQRYEGSNKFQRRKRFVAHSTKWAFTDLKWRFRDPFNLFKDIEDFEIVRQTISHALDMWSRASKRSLTFVDKSYERNSTFVNIDTFFATGDHGDHEAFDGRGGIVAHSGYPMVGKIHFDADELWTIEGDKGIDLRYVTLHETGHALGLRHSRNSEAVMYPIYRKNPTEIALSDDDTEGIRYLYENPVESGSRRKRYRRPAEKSHYYKRLDFEEEKT